MLTADMVKDYLRIVGDDDDSFIEGIICAGRTYLENAVDDFGEKYGKDTEFTRLADTWLLTQWSPTMYDQREGMTAGGEGLGYVARSMITQLQLMNVEVK